MKYYIGIDPGRSTGVAVYNNKTKKIHELKTLDFWTTISFVRSFIQYMGGLMSTNDTFEVVMEDPQLNAPIFKDRHGRKSIDVQLDIAQKVGRNKENAFLLTQYFKTNGIKFRIVKPMSGKWNAIYFKQVTGFSDGGNQHQRDAAKIVYGI